MKPQSWSPTKLDCFANCPKQFYEKYVSKRFAESEADKTPEQLWGTWAHKQFEDRLAVNTPLPKELADHEPFMVELASLAGVLNTEQKVALDKRALPCAFFDRDAWVRMVIDVIIVNRSRARVVDYKTGKPHSKFKQLKLYALYAFSHYPAVDLVACEYYWTKDGSRTGEVYRRDQVESLWGEFLGDLKQYKQAFKHDIWQERPSGLCRGFCPVTDCRHWKPKRSY